MKPLVAIVGRPNVGKSTFFNRMIGQHLAIVEDLPGTTRDRLYGDAEWNGRIFTLIDTGGLELGDTDNITALIRAQAELAMEEADVIVLLVDASAGLLAMDREIANLLRRVKKPIVLGVNKADNKTFRENAVEYYALNLGEPIAISSKQGVGTGDLLDAITDVLPPPTPEDERPDVPRIAIIGRPNVGKSSLLNGILGQERVIVSDIPGTTRDAIDTEVDFEGQSLLLIDTAGVRRRGRVGPGIEKYSVLRSERAIDRCDIALLVIDATEGVTAQDTHIAGMVQEQHKGVIVVINKWDIIKEQRDLVAAAERDLTLPVPKIEPPLDPETFREEIREALKFIPYAPLIFASAKTRYHIQTIMRTAISIYQTRQQHLSTPKLNELVREAMLRHPPASIKGRALKIYYVTQPEVNPPTFIFFVNDQELVHFAYERYIENQIRRMFAYQGTGIKIIFKTRESVDRHEEAGG